MNANDITDKLIKLPRVFNSRGNISISDLLKETGYYEMNQQVSKEIIQTALSQQPECVDEWLSYSEDKRSSAGWYLKQEDINTYVLGFISGKAEENSQERYSDRIAACAAFIKHEAEDIKKTTKMERLLK